MEFSRRNASGRPDLLLMRHLSTARQAAYQVQGRECGLWFGLKAMRPFLVVTAERHSVINPQEDDQPDCPLFSHRYCAYIELMNALRRHIAALLLAVFALGLVLPSAQASQVHQMAGMSGMAMDHASMPINAAKGVVDLCKAHCQAVIGVLPQPVHATCPKQAPAVMALGLAIGLPSETIIPEGPPPKA